MNVYSCWYNGAYGYCCRKKNSNWLFVPELGQPINHIVKNIRLGELSFSNPYILDLEKQRHNKKLFSQLLNFIIELLYPQTKPVTVGGALFSFS